MTKPFKPLLAAKAPADLSEIKFPVLASPKLDGIRVLVTTDGAVSRQLKPIPNNFIRQFLSTRLLVGLDGEVVTYTNGDRDDFNTIQSKVMSKDGQPEFLFTVFDDFTDSFAPYISRLERARHRIVNLQKNGAGDNLSFLAHDKVANAHDLLKLEDHYVKHGEEGLMYRSLDGLYKFGRSTTKAGPLWKMKRFHDAEVVIVGVVERMHNANEATTDALGHTKRSTHKANLVPTGTLGAFRCVWSDKVSYKTPEGGWDEKDVFEVGTGFTEDQRKTYWEFQSRHHLSMATITYQEITKEGKPRFPVFKGFRPEVQQ